MRLTILHTNDLHGRIDALARVATIVEEIRARTPHPVLYVDAGDVEEASVRLSNLTKGTAMHRLLSAAGCSAAAVGNAAWLRYGAHVLADHAEAASYPLLVANLRPVDGAVPAVLLDRVGFVGVTDPFRGFLDDFHAGLEAVDEASVVVEHARALRAQGAELVVCLSHIGLDELPGRDDVTITDRRLAPEVAGEVDLIVGAHTHDVLPHGEPAGRVLIAQAGCYGEYLGRVEIDGGRLDASLIRVPEETAPHPAVLAEAEQVERELEAFLDEVVAVLDRPLDTAGVAEIMRVRMGAEVGLAAEGATLTAALPPGPLRRGTLWEACESTGNPGVTTMAGARLRALLDRAAQPDVMSDRPRPLRGRPRGRMLVAGPETIDPARDYVVAGTDWELEPHGGLVDPAWQLQVRYDFPTIVREAVEEALGKENAC